MNIPEKMISHYDLAEFTYKHLTDDRQDYVIEKLNEIVTSDESTIEDKVLALEKLGDINWSYLGDYEAALDYTQKALELSESTPDDFKFILRGNIFESKLYILKLMEKPEDIKKEIREVIERFSNSTYSSNSYLYFAYRYLARIEFSLKNYELAYELLLKAKQYYPINFCTSFEAEVELTDYRRCYDNLAFLLSRYVTGIGAWEI